MERSHRCRGLAASSVALVGISVATAAAATLAWGPPHALRGVPRNAPGGSSAVLASLACPSLRSCVAVGDVGRTLHTDPSTGWSLPTVLSESGGAWQQAREITLPANATAGNGQEAQLYSVTCPTSRSCVAVGVYDDRAGTGQPMAVGESGGVWGQAHEITAPSSGGGGLFSVACRSAGSCVAVGSEIDGSGNSLPMVVSESGGVWGRGRAIALPSSADLQQGNQLSSVACPSAGACVAVGQYDRSSASFNPPTSHAMVVSESAGVWGRAFDVALPPAFGSRQAIEDELSSVACPAVSACVAVGRYDDTSSGNGHPMVVSENAGAWDATGIALPVGARGGQDTGLTAVACPTSGSCVAVGQYDNVGGGEVAMGVTGAARTWGRASAIALSSHPAHGPGEQGSLDAIACPIVGSCAALGDNVVVTTPRG